MSQRLKRWESPRREGRNDKGRGGAARRRQLKKQMQMLRQRLKEGEGRSPSCKHGTDNSKRQGEEKLIFPLLFYAAAILATAVERRVEPLASTQPARHSAITFPEC